jgi:hypothetical protein
MEKSRFVEGVCLPGERPRGTLSERASSFWTGSRAPFRTMCRRAVRRHDHVVEVIGFLALFLMTFVVVGRDSDDWD